MSLTIQSTAFDPGQAEVEAAMRGHVLASAELIGTYQKAGR